MEDRMTRLFVVVFSETELFFYNVLMPEKASVNGKSDVGLHAVHPFGFNMAEHCQSRTGNVFHLHATYTVLVYNLNNITFSRFPYVDTEDRVKV